MRGDLGQPVPSLPTALGYEKMLSKQFCIADVKVKGIKIRPALYTLTCKEVVGVALNINLVLTKI